jgi:hypothetical protein
MGDRDAISGTPKGHERLVKDAVILRAIDTDMSRGFDIPRAWIESTAVGIFSSEPPSCRPSQTHQIKFKLPA